ncbi:MAG TPA: LytTR family DNA-binding domain-containing protein [Phnomibacter sp.]|nr:LytTR family DNA-binding domain-containing protein [Phnomibacter sp.]
MKAVIIEDESLIARELMHKIASVAPDVEVIAHLDSLEAAGEWLRSHPLPDLFFMDIQLGDGVSFDLFSKFEINSPVIFCTAYDEYAIQAFKVNGTDYLLKPLDTDELKKAIDKCRTIVESKTPYPQDMRSLLQVLAGGQTPSRYKEKFIVSSRKQWIPIDTTDIAVFMRENLNYLITFTGEKYILDFTTLEEVESLLDPRLYYRINRQTIIHINAIKAVKPLDNATLTVTLKDPLNMETSVGRAKAPEFKKWFDR